MSFTCILEVALYYYLKTFWQDKRMDDNSKNYEEEMRNITESLPMSLK